MHSFLLLLTALLASQAWGQKGSVIVIQTKGLVEAISPTGSKLKEPVVRGSVLPEGYSIKTNLFSESVLLFSNGTTATIQENSVFKLIAFEQAPFEAQNQSFGQLENEPSTSTVSIEMEIGSLIVQTKKLNKNSSFSIQTPSGTAGIRGTQFQLAFSPNTGMQLDVAESKVAFTPAGRSQPVLVGPGRGLDSSPSGQIKQRPINPIVSQNISSKNSAATSSCAAVPLVTAKQANSKAASNSTKQPGGEGSGDGGVNGDSGNVDSSDNGIQNVDGNEAPEPPIIEKSKLLPSNQDSGKRKAADDFIKQSSKSVREVSGQETSPIYLEKVLSILDENNDVAPAFAPTQDNGTDDNDDAPVSPPPGFTPSTRPVTDFQLSQNSVNSESLDFTAIDLFGNDNIAPPIELSGGSSREDLYDLLDEWLPDQEPDWIKIPALDADGKVIRDDNENVVYQDTDGYFYTASIALEQFLNYPAYTSYSNVNESFRMAWFLTSLFFHDLNGEHAIAGNHLLTNADWNGIAGGTITPGAVLNAKDLIDFYGSSPYLHSLGIALIDAGALGDTNKDVAHSILNLLKDETTGSINFTNSFTLGEVLGNNVLNSALLGATHEDLLDELDSPEKQRELEKLFKLYPDNLNAVLGADIQIGSNNSPTSVNLGQWLQKATIFEGDASSNTNDPSNDKKVFAFAAGKDLHLAGDVTFKNSVNGVINKTEDHALVLGSAQQTNIGHIEGSGPLPSTPDDPYPTKIDFEGSNLGIGSYENLTLTNVAIDVGGNLALGTLSDMHITQTDISVGRHSDRDNVYMYADNFLAANNLTFSGRTREIYIEANTIDLRDVHFPSDSEVMLRSRDGAPYFYGPDTSNPDTSYKPFQVNFYSESNTYGGQAIKESEFSIKTHGVKGYNSQNFKTGAGDAAIKIRAFPDAK